ncbi:hypothetical protein [Aurantiacibacter poecillastricola]|uniref:hypothetical protein n=1 Tax=Aurantiacibacter poecillastricola TaxID=3064385 RepID=UPI00273DAC89|nr:hypothetical protein [Aurantiacibacter sp. 219JJ12-13]MDP5261425.1 hypothetical protein [Aurantiacibacter sp. 219JJ12-13]
MTGQSIIHARGQVGSPDSGPAWYSGWLPRGALRRGRALFLALAIELLIILLLLSIGFRTEMSGPEAPTITSFDVSQAPESAQPEEPDTPESTQQDQAVSPSLAPIAPQQPSLPTALPVPIPAPLTVPPPEPRPSPAPTPTASATSSIRAVVRPGANYGPADTGNSRGADSERVGTAPDGSPLYAASWYREPGPEDLAGYLSTARSPGWALIACRTAPEWRVEDCEIIDEYPQGAGIARAVQAAAWQFKVRPPRLGGEYQVGSWVRIRIDYTRRSRGS